MKKLKLFLLNTIILIFSSIILRVMGIYFGIYISNRIGTEKLGIFSLVMSVYLFGITLATSGINLASTRVISEELALGNKSSIRNVTKKCISISLFTGILASLLFYIFSDFIVSICLHDKVEKEVIHLFCLALPLISMSAAINGYFAAIRKIYKNVAGQFLEQSTKILVSAYLLSLFLPKSINYACFSLILGDLISEIVSFTFIYIAYVLDKNKYISTNDKTNTIYSRNYTKRIFRISIPVAITSYIRSGLNTFKQILIPSSLEKHGLNCSLALSKYGIISSMAIPVITFPDVFIKSFSNLIIPEFSRYYVKKDYRNIRKFTSILLFLTLIISIFIAIFLYFFSDSIGTWIYKDVSIGMFIKLLAPLSIFIYLDSIIDSILRGLDVQVGVMIINIIDLVFTVSFIYFLVPILGIKGYIYSIYISELLNFFISFLQLFKKVYILSRN